MLKIITAVRTYTKELREAEGLISKKRKGKN
jgi:hypothetical protein